MSYSFDSTIHYLWYMYLFDIEVLHIQGNTDIYTHLHGRYSYHGYTVNSDILSHLKISNRLPCSSSPCAHGTCTNQVNSYTCQCQPGYTGKKL